MIERKADMKNYKKLSINTLLLSSLLYLPIGCSIQKEAPYQGNIAKIKEPDLSQSSWDAIDIEENEDYLEAAPTFTVSDNYREMILAVPRTEPTLNPKFDSEQNFYEDIFYGKELITTGYDMHYQPITELAYKFDLGGNLIARYDYPEVKKIQSYYHNNLGIDFNLEEVDLFYIKTWGNYISHETGKTITPPFTNHQIYALANKVFDHYIAYDVPMDLMQSLYDLKRVERNTSKTI